MQRIEHLAILCCGLACGLLACSSSEQPEPDGATDGDADRDLDAEQDAAPDVGPTTCAADAEDFPEPATGRCRAVVLDEGALLATGPDGEDGHVVPGGQRLTRVGRILELPGFPMRAVEVPGTSYVVVTDGWKHDEQLSVVDVEALAVVDSEVFTRRGGGALFVGLAVSDDGTRLWASGGGSNVVLAYDLDVETGQLTEAPERHITVADDTPSGYVSGIALGPDGLLAVNLMLGAELLLWDTEAGRELRRVPLERSSLPYDVVLTPDGATAYVSLWAGRAVVAVDVASGTVTSTLDVGKNPEGLTLSPDAGQVVAANADSDSITVIDAALESVGFTHWIVGEDAPRGASPAAVRFGPDGRLFVVNALDNAVDVLERTPSGGFRRQGRIPTMWHPTDALPLSDGRVLVLTGRYEGTGPNVSPGDTDIDDLVGGSLSVIEADDLDDDTLRGWEVEVDRNNSRMTRFNGVECDDGAEYDFPIPQPGDGPSPFIRHVVLIVRENKTYDAYLGDLTDDAGEPHGDGDPSLTLLPREEMPEVLPNTLTLARTFALGDNYYSHAEASIQGHVWTAFGRTTDFVERSWLTTSGRSYWGIPPQGTRDVSYPEEGSAFEYFVREGIEVSNCGEIVGSRSVAAERDYPGLYYSYVPDIDKARWIEERVVDRCRLAQFTYVVMPCDHTRGLDPGAPTPRSMLADNDEGVGRVVHALSHSTYWPQTVIFVIEDDPQQGGDHVDNHRSPVLVISPWARRGHASSVHYDEASIYRTIQLILGPDAPHSAGWHAAAPMYDMFTSTPDYTPYEHVPRRWPEELNPDDGSHDAWISSLYDWSRPDEQPGLPRMLWRHLRGTEPPWRPFRDPFDDEE